MRTARLRIVDLLAKKETEKAGDETNETFFTISDISKSLRLAYSHTYNYIKEMEKQNVVNLKKIGNSFVVKLNMKENTTLSMLSLIYNKNNKKLVEWKQKDKRSEKILKRINQIKDNVHCVLLKNNKIIIVKPTNLKDFGFKIFQNRKIIDAFELKQNFNYYKDCLILYGAEKFFSLIN